jgi:hypothetical protein
MKKLIHGLLPVLMAFAILCGCAPRTDEYTEQMKAKLEQFEEVTLTTDLSWLSESEREIIRILIQAADIMDDIFWTQSYGNKDELMAKIDNQYARDYARIHYGPWSRIAGNTSFVPGYEAKPLGANFYPQDMTKEEFDAWDEPSKESLYTLIRRNDQGNLVAIPYSDAYKQQHDEAARLMRKPLSWQMMPG